MAQCFEPYCNVDPATGALSITTKSGTCTVMPGDDVKVQEHDSGWTITVNGETTVIPKVDPGDDVSFTETDDEYIVTINNTPHTIKKCDRTWVGCDGEYLEACRDRIVSCEYLNDQKYLQTVVTDNSIDGDGTPEDPLSTHAFTTDLLTGTGKENDPLDINTSVLFADACFSAPQEFDGCGNNKSVNFFEQEPGCWKLGVFSEEAKKVVRVTATDSSLVVPERNDVYLWPDDFGAVYERSSAIDDYAAGVIDENIMRRNVVSSETFTLPCATKFLPDLTTLVVEGADVAAAFSERVAFSYRYRVDGGEWVYPETGVAPNIGLYTTGVYKSLEEVINRTLSVVALPAGQIDYQLLAFTVGSSDPAKLKVGNRPLSLGSVYRGPTVTLTPITD